MASELHILFFPLMSPGHFIPLVDMARTFASRGVRSTVVTTPSHGPVILPAPNLHVLTVPFPSPDLTGLAPGQENLSSIPSSLLNSFVAALFHFRAPLESIIAQHKPHCLISDSLFTWTADLAAQFDIPRIIFHGAGAFPLYVTTNIFSHFPLDESKASFLMDGLPSKIQLYRDGLPDLFSNVPFLMLMAEAEQKSYGVVVNTYREMEPNYVDFYKSIKKSWCVGPVSLSNKAEDEKAVRGEKPAAKERIVKWLDSKAEGSVVYLCFGSLCHFNAAQLKEIALGLEESGKDFLWVVRKEPEGEAAAEEEWMPVGYEARVGERGLVVRGWAPQTVVLEHAAVGWFVTHCGWNSLQEAACAGVPMVTWPLFHEQFINAELVVEVMGVGARMWEGFRRSEFKAGEEAVVKAEEITEVVKRVMGGGEEYEEMRRKAKEFGVEASKAVEEGGSSHEDITALIEDLKAKAGAKSE